MSMVTSCTHVLSRAAPAAKLPHAALHSGKPAAMALQMKPRRLSVRCAAESGEHWFDIAPFALVHPKFPPTARENYWRIREDEEQVKLWFHVGDTARKDNLEVRIEHDVLLVRCKSAGNLGEAARSLDVRLLVPKGYDQSKVDAELTFGSLLVTIGKKKPVGDNIPDISPKEAK